MADVLYIRMLLDPPHAAGRPGYFRCGQPSINAVVITEKQALVWLSNRRCQGCFPEFTRAEGTRKEGRRPR